MEDIREGQGLLQNGWHDYSCILCRWLPAGRRAFIRGRWHDAVIIRILKLQTKSIWVIGVRGVPVALATSIANACPSPRDRPSHAIRLAILSSV